MNYVTLVGPMFSLCCTLLVIFGRALINKLSEKTTIRLWEMALLPYLFFVILFPQFITNLFPFLRSWSIQFFL
jgi:hypothetical protein